MVFHQALTVYHPCLNALAQLLPLAESCNYVSYHPQDNVDLCIVISFSMYLDCNGMYMWIDSIRQIFDLLSFASVTGDALIVYLGAPKTRQH